MTALEGKHALVTGGSRGTGRSIRRKLAAGKRPGGSDDQRRRALLAVLAVANAGYEQVLLGPTLDPVAQRLQTGGMEPHAAFDGFRRILDGTSNGHHTFVKPVPEIATPAARDRVAARAFPG